MFVGRVVLEELVRYCLKYRLWEVGCVYEGFRCSLYILFPKINTEGGSFAALLVSTRFPMNASTQILNAGTQMLLKF